MSLTDFVDALCKESTAEAVNELSVFISAIYTQENDRDDILHMRLVNVERWAKDQGIRWNLLYPMVQALAVATVEPEEQSRFKSIWDTFTTEKVSIVDIGNMLADRYPQTLETFLEIINYVIKEKDEIENVSGGISRAWEYGGGSVAIGGSLATGVYYFKKKRNTPNDSEGSEIPNGADLSFEEPHRPGSATPPTEAPETKTTSMGDTIDGLPSTGGRVNTFMDKLQGLFTNNRLARKRAADGYRGIRNVNDPYEDKDAITRRPARIWEDENLPNLITWEDNPDNIVDSRIEKSTSSVVDETANKTNAIIETEESALGDL